METTNQSAQVTPPSTLFSGPVMFNGQGREFFGIWIVNILLTILTLGIYSAWAKVRTYQYFYGNTQIDGHSFEYLATPMQILKGRLLAVAVFIIYSVAVQMFPLFGLVLAIGFVLLMPWIINQGLRFNLRMTRHRNVRFSFKGTYSEAFVNFVLLPFLSVFTLYLLLPYALKRIDQYMHENIYYGNKPVSVKLEGSTYYAAALITIGLGVLAMIIFGIFIGGAGAIAAISGGESVGATAASMLIALVSMVTYFVVFMFIGAVYHCIIRNHIFNNSEFEDVAKFESDLKPLEYGFVMFTNALAIVCTLGLAYPWTKVRRARVLAQATQVTIFSGALSLIDVAQQEQSSFAEEAANVFDVDISLT